MEGIATFAKDFAARWLWALTGSVPGAILAVISLVRPSLIDWPLWVWALVIFFPAALLGAYRVADDLRARLHQVEARLLAIGAERPLAFVTADLVFENGPRRGTYLVRRIGIRFENTGDKMLSYAVVKLTYGLDGYQEIDARPSGEIRYIAANRPMTWGGDLSIPLSINSLPAKMRFSFKIEYDNVPPLKVRSTEQTVEYTFHSVEPLNATNLVLAHVEA